MSDQPQARIDRRHFLIGGAVIGAGLYVGIRVSENRFGSNGTMSRSAWGRQWMKRVLRKYIELDGAPPTAVPPE